MKTTSLYVLVTLGILGWWMLAFQDSLFPPSDASHFTFSPKTTNELPSIPKLSPLKRSTLQQALAGDYALMTQLIADWHVDAQILAAQHIKSIRQLPESSFLYSQMIGRELTNSSRLYSKQRFLPQTYASGAFLLALVSPDQIVALPYGLRKQTQLFPETLTNQIPLNIDRHHSELLYLAKPEIAFVSTQYSHPATLEALKNQGIPIVPTTSIHSLKDIQNSLLQIGYAVNRGMEAKLLNLFIESALMAIENRLHAINALDQDTYDQIVYLNHYSQFFTPSPGTFTCELLEKLGLTTSSAWSYIPLTQEHFLKIDPSKLIIATMQPELICQQISASPSFSQLKACQNQNTIFIDREVQESPTQYVVLAYYDLATALTSLSVP
jgi:iron complex transport system substrate-binding protein